MSTPRPHKEAALETLRRRLAALAPAAPAFAGAEPSGLAALAPRPGELIELRPAAYFDGPAAAGLLAAMAAAAAKDSAGPVLWCRRARDSAGDFGAPCPHGLAAFGLAADRVILALAEDAAGALWAMEEGARASGLAAVLGEPGRGRAYGLTASRRLKLAAEKTGTAVFALRAFDAAGPTAARRRWRIQAAASQARPWRGAAGLPALGPPRWRVTQERGRGQEGTSFEIEWDDETLCFREPEAVADGAAGPRRAPARRRRA